MSQVSSPNNTQKWIAGALGLKNNDSPFSWQMRLFENFKKGEIPRLLDIPTGLGKTGVMAIWLVARAIGAPMPRRLVYIVDRRAVVDQATEVALNIRTFVENTPELKKNLDLEAHALPISTLRGKFVDNKEWLENPVSPAIIVGTIDMIGSRLLFEGYNVSRRMRPFHAALLGTDSLIVLDEAHLVPPFEKLLETIDDGKNVFGPYKEEQKIIIPTFKLIALSATGQSDSGTIFNIDNADLKVGTVTSQRLNAKKQIVIEDIEDGKELSEALAKNAWKLSENGKLAVKIVVFCDKREDAEKVKKAIEKHSMGVNKKEKPPIELLVGSRRVYEREKVAQWLKIHGFADKDINVEEPTFLVATSAGEVGVDLDADHMVSDLVAWERMVQRLGRVNRFGNGAARVNIIVSYDKKAPDAYKKTPEIRNENEQELAEKYERLIATRELLAKLPKINGGYDGSPIALCNLKNMANNNDELKSLFDKAITPSPLRPALTRPLVDAWSMTSLKEHTGRPEIGPWLRGWVDDKPRVSVIWRKYLPVRWSGDRRVSVSASETEAFFEAAPPHMSEMLETESYRVVEWLKKRAKIIEPPQFVGSSADTDNEDQDIHYLIQEDDIVANVLSPAHEIKKLLTLSNLLQEKEELDDLSSGCIIVLDARIGGLSDGLLDKDKKSTPRTADDGQLWTQVGSENAQSTPVVHFRIRKMNEELDEDVNEEWHESLRFPTKVMEDGESSEWLIIEKWHGSSETEESRSTGYLQLLDNHKEEVEKKVQFIADKLSFPEEYANMLRITARLHDEGKRVNCWQQAFNAPKDGRTYAKTKGPIDQDILNKYRHELGSLLFAEKDPELLALPEDKRELALHMITAHHGFARPVITTHGCEEAPPSLLNEKSKEIALRFARLQKQWGPWGLAWWETVLRAADQQASRVDEETINTNGGKRDG